MQATAAAFFHSGKTPQEERITKLRPDEEEEDIGSKLGRVVLHTRPKDFWAHMHPGHSRASNRIVQYSGEECKFGHAAARIWPVVDNRYVISVQLLKAVSVF